MLWERERTTACQVLRHGDWYYMFYIGFEDMDKARICLARSRDGVTGWERHPENPIIAGSEGYWYWLCICKPTVLKSDDGFLMWYNGVNTSYNDGEGAEELGLARHPGFDLWPQKDQPRERKMDEQVIIPCDLFLGQ